MKNVELMTDIEIDGELGLLKSMPETEENTERDLDLTNEHRVRIARGLGQDLKTYSHNRQEEERAKARVERDMIASMNAKQRIIYYMENMLNPAANPLMVGSRGPNGCINGGVTQEVVDQLPLGAIEEWYRQNDPRYNIDEDFTLTTPRTVKKFDTAEDAFKQKYKMVYNLFYDMFVKEFSRTGALPTKRVNKLLAEAEARKTDTVKSLARGKRLMSNLHLSATEKNTLMAREYNRFFNV